MVVCTYMYRYSPWARIRYLRSVGWYLLCDEELGLLQRMFARPQAICLAETKPRDSCAPEHRPRCIVTWNGKQHCVEIGPNIKQSAYDSTVLRDVWSPVSSSACLCEQVPASSSCMLIDVSAIDMFLERKADESLTCAHAPVLSLTCTPHPIHLQLSKTGSQHTWWLLVSTAAKREAFTHLAVSLPIVHKWAERFKHFSDFLKRQQFKRQHQSSHKQSCNCNVHVRTCIHNTISPGWRSLQEKMCQNALLNKYCILRTCT